MNPWVKRKWVRALKSGKYGKGNGFLGFRGRYCCLGVLACEMVPEFAIIHYDKMRVGTSISFLPDDLAIMFGVDKDAQHDLANINDNSHTFEPVIAYIEEHL